VIDPTEQHHQQVVRSCQSVRAGCPARAVGLPAGAAHPHV